MKPFSQRVGAVPARRTIQIDDMDDALRNSLWNEIFDFYRQESSPPWERVASTVAKHVHKVPVDSVGDTPAQALGWFRSAFFQGPWYQRYEIIEHLYVSESDQASHISRIFGGTMQHEDRSVLLKSRLNSVLKRELSGYRFIDNILTPITSPEEVSAIENAISNLEVVGQAGAGSAPPSGVTQEVL